MQGRKGCLAEVVRDRGRTGGGGGEGETDIHQGQIRGQTQGAIEGARDKKNG